MQFQNGALTLEKDRRRSGQPACAVCAAAAYDFYDRVWPFIFA